MGGLDPMRACQKEAADLVKWIESLQEPYRGNTITWLRIYIRKPLEDLHQDIETFLAELDPMVRDYFLVHIRRLLKTAVHYFGDEGWEPVSSLDECQEESHQVHRMAA
jgi:hypothetical protein